MTTERPGYWLIQAGAFAVALTAIAEGEYNIVDGFIAPVPGDAPPDGFQEDTPDAVLSAFTVEAGNIQATWDIAKLSADESNERLPVSSMALSGTASTSSTASGALAAATLPVDVTGDSETALSIPPFDDLQRPALDAAGETNERLPVNLLSLSGSASTLGTTSGALAVAGAAIDVASETAYTDALGPPDHAEHFAAIAALTEANERLPISTPAFTGTTTTAGTATGTLAGAALPVDVQGDVDGAFLVPPAEEPFRFTLDAASESSERHSVSAIALTGTAPSLSTASGTLAGSSLPVDVAADTFLVELLAPDTDHTSTLHAASEDNHAIPVDGAVAPQGDAPPGEDEPAFIDPDAPYSLPDPEELPVTAVALTGTATTIGTASGTLGVSALITPDVPDIPHEPLPFIVADDSEPPVGPIALTGTATTTGTASGTLNASALIAPDNPDIILEPPPFIVADDPAPFAMPVALSGTASSTGSTSGTLATTALPVDVSPETAYSDSLEPDTSTTTAILMVAEGEYNIVDGFIPGDPPPPEDDSADVALLIPPPSWLVPETDEYPAWIQTSNVFVRSHVQIAFPNYNATLNEPEYDAKLDLPIYSKALENREYSKKLDAPSYNRDLKAT